MHENHLDFVVSSFFVLTVGFLLRGIIWESTNHSKQQAKECADFFCCGYEPNRRAPVLLFVLLIRQVKPLLQTFFFLLLFWPKKKRSHWCIQHSWNYMQLCFILLGGAKFASACLGDSLRCRSFSHLMQEEWCGDNYCLNSSDFT